MLPAETCFGVVQIYQHTPDAEGVRKTWVYYPRTGRWGVRSYPPGSFRAAEVPVAETDVPLLVRQSVNGDLLAPNIGAVYPMKMVD